MLIHFMGIDKYHILTFTADPLGIQDLPCAYCSQLRSGASYAGFRFRVAKFFIGRFTHAAAPRCIGTYRH